ncbi:hypothetical protein BDN70DRAFT_155351 [Pholiota conissans]|uniref:Molybdopterin synthase sulfur carrier subunit n=1 Tax=Pholiota conissans TaxID=109636 RepID=A0A9P5YVR6_9AGAR|nr:hypothetical protein BDN70DRAFT_155351 [Pholiota conissans]
MRDYYKDCGQSIASTGFTSFTYDAMSVDTANTITVLYFAAASTATGITSEKVPIPQSGLKLSELPELLASRHPAADLGPILETSQWSVDCEMIDDTETTTLKGGEEIGVICPVSGG